MIWKGDHMTLPLQNAMDSNSWKSRMWVHPLCVEWNTPNCLRGHLLQTCARGKDDHQLDWVVTRELESSEAKVSLKRRAKEAWQFVKVERVRWEEGSMVWHCEKWPPTSQTPSSLDRAPSCGVPAPSQGLSIWAGTQGPSWHVWGLVGCFLTCVGQWVVGSGRSSPDAGAAICPTQRMRELPLPLDGAPGDPRTPAAAWCTPSSVHLCVWLEPFGISYRRVFRNLQLFTNLS